MERKSQAVSLQRLFAVHLLPFNRCLVLHQGTVQGWIARGAARKALRLWISWEESVRILLFVFGH